MPRLCPTGAYERAWAHFEDDPKEGLVDLVQLAKNYSKDLTMAQGFDMHDTTRSNVRVHSHQNRMTP